MAGVLQEEGPVPDPKCKLIISSFLTLPHLLDYVICSWNVMSIVSLLGGDRLGRTWLIYISMLERGRRWVSCYSFCFFSSAFVFRFLMFSLLYLVTGA